ncbi:MAG: pyrroline-5-carboxylate reductase [Proteobacteria bacterium]|nr:pyrroline-5-carboxylate reductase [Pseudomonadota bacterium]
MGLALLKGWLKSGREGSDIVVVDPSPGDELRTLASVQEIPLMATVDQKVRAGAIVLAVKPQISTAVLGAIKSAAGKQTIVISIMAGTKLATLRTALPHAGAIVRAMPNLPASVGRGMTVAVSEGSARDSDLAAARALLEATGAFEWLGDEGLLDVVTGLSGSGPAYVFYLVECLTKAGIDLGLQPHIAEKLARSTVEGAGELLYQSERTPKELRDQVTSPGGTTAAGIGVLMDGRLQEIATAAVQAAKTRSQQLSSD